MRKKVISILTAVFIFFNLSAQIYAPEGLNMPGDWDSWNNPPTNLVLAGEAQTSGGGVRLINQLSSIYQTQFSVAATGGDIIGGTYSFVFSSGPSTNYWSNKWCDVNVTANTIQDYIWYNDGNGTNNTITLTDGSWHTMNFENTGYANSRAVFMQTSSQPAQISTVSHLPMMPAATDDVTVSVELASTPAAEEIFYVRYTTDNWTSSNLVEVSFTGLSGTAIISALPDATVVQYYVFSTVFNSPTQDYDLITLSFDKNNGSYFSYTVGATIDCVGQTGVVLTIPIFPLQDGSVTILFDATLGNGALAGYIGDVYAHTGVITSLSNGNNDWRYVVSNWGENTPETMFTNTGQDTYELTINNIRTYYNVPVDEDIYKIAMVIRSGEPILPEEPDNFYVARNADGTDFHLDVYDTGVHVKLTSPSKKDPLVDQNQLVPVCVSAIDATAITLFIDDIQVASENALELSYVLNTGDYLPGMHTIIAVADGAKLQDKDTTYFFIRDDVVIQDLPAGMKNGVNYIDDNTVTFVLHDPSGLKEFAFVIGDFNDWTTSNDGYMRRTPDGKKFWATITGLTPGVEYAYQFYVDGELKLADGYCDLVLDPWNDRWIPETTYPNMKSYPWDKTIGVVSVLQIGQQDFPWEVTNFIPQATGVTQSNLIIYELLIRDFVESRDIKDVIDSLDYLQRLGINAIELMPVNEFDGNDSWGYNPAFYFATDKAYGTKNDYKTFIDECHKRGIAVILDVVYNHSFGQSPFVQLYNEGTTGPPTPENPYFNADADPGTEGYQTCHPYSVGYDFNHSSPYTKQLVKDNLEYWMTEFKIDGFRFDLTKGFTQTYTGNDVGAWSMYDQSRIDILTEYYNHVKGIKSDAYVIFEHLSNNDEEVILANTGILLWGVMGEQFNQCTMGWDSNHDFSWANYANRGFTYPNLIPYMESHDEERIMYRNLAYGNGIANDTTASLKKTEAIVPFYMAVPGPKMIWQFGELGYDESIELCSDSSYSNDCRIEAKPIHWEYNNDIRRQKIFWTYKGMAKLKTENDAFIFGSYSDDQSGLGKRQWISHSNLNVTISGNFASYGFDMAPGFQHTGTWYDYFTGEQIDVSDAGGYTIHYEPGDFKVYTDVQLERPYVQITFNVTDDLSSPISGAIISLQSNGSYTTNVSGVSELLTSPNQSLNYTVSCSGYNSVSGTAVLGGSDEIINIQMQAVNVENVEENMFGIYPNPADDFVNITAKENGTLVIYDITGKVINKYFINKGENTFETTGFNSGVYLFQFSNEKTIKVEKLIVK